MDAATENQIAKAKLAAILGGLEAGMVGVLWMLVWLGVSSLWQQRSFWTPENLMSTAFDRNSTLAPLFTWSTCVGLAIYLLMYSILGALFSWITRDRLPRGRVMLWAVVYSLAWYYFAYRWMFRFTLPLVALLHVEHATVLGHLLFGTLLGRYPLYVQQMMRTGPVVEEVAPVLIEAPVSEAEASD